MKAYQIFKQQLEFMQKQARQDERVRVEAMGIEAREILLWKGRSDPDTIIIHGSTFTMLKPC